MFTTSLNTDHKAPQGTLSGRRRFRVVRNTTKGTVRTFRMSDLERVG